MNINLDRAEEPFAVNAYDAGWIQIGEHRVSEPCIVASDSLSSGNLPSSPAQLDRSHFQAVFDKRPQIVLLGTGATQQFVDFAITAALAEVGVALEVMDTGAACRLFNILLTEARPTMAILYPV